MIRWIAAASGAVLLSIFVLSCNSIAGIDGEEAAECSVAAECAALGECIKPTCNDGICEHAFADARAPCSGGFCDGQARCVECLDAEDCMADPFSSICDVESGRCVECLTSVDCKTALRPYCSNHVCVQCVTEASCEASTAPCLAARCLDGACWLVARAATERCLGGSCDGKGACVPSILNRRYLSPDAP